MPLTITFYVFIVHSYLKYSFESHCHDKFTKCYFHVTVLIICIYVGRRLQSFTKCSKHHSLSNGGLFSKISGVYYGSGGCYCYPLVQKAGTQLRVQYVQVLRLRVVLLCTLWLWSIYHFLSNVSTHSSQQRHIRTRCIITASQAKIK